MEVFLSDAPTPFDTRQAFHDFVSTVILRSFQSALPPEERSGFVDAFVDACPAYHLDYVRLNITAAKERQPQMHTDKHSAAKPQPKQ